MARTSDHWNDVYTQRAPTEVSWFQAEAQASVELIAATRARLDGPVIDIGAGSSLLVDGLLARGYCDVTLLKEHERAAYRTVLASALEPDAHAIIATFAIDGPERCSGLPVQRYSADLLAKEFSGILEPVEERSDLHVTPKGSKQSFVFVRFRRAP